MRYIAFFRVGVPDIADDTRVDYASALRTTLQQQRMRGLFEGLRKAAVPLVYLMLMRESGPKGRDASILEFDLVVGTWADLEASDEFAPVIEQRAGVLSATLSVALPSATIVRLARGDLTGFIKSIFLPVGKTFPQTGSAAVAGAMCTFDQISPSASNLDKIPEFFVPNAAESGSEGVVLGPTRSEGNEFHDLGLLLEDLQRHVGVFGMTGSGKSTTTGSIAKQVIEMGLPTLILDWHNEYGIMVKASGGRIVAPGKDEFSINPLEMSPGADPAEHVAMVSDIFSDIYHFTHPQAYMFRNALQKRLNETDGDEMPSISALVRTIEAFPLRSAYDNETKVALLRRLVPLTQGQSGKALTGSNPIQLEELLGAPICVELGHMRDVQSRSVFTDVFLKMIYEEKVRRKGVLDHFTVVEEARNIAPFRRPEDPPTVGERMISELRKFGESMLFVAQFPSHMAPEVVKNSGTKIVHRLPWPDDVALIGDSLGLSPKQREYLTKLKTGEAVVGLTRIQQPVLVRIEQHHDSSLERSDLSFAPVS